METAIATRSAGSQSGLLQPSSFADAIAFAELMCKASLVPAHLQDKPADCLLVIEQAQRWGLSPFAVAACTSVIQGKLMFEGKLVAAVINAKGDLEDRLSYTYDGEGNARTVLVSGRLRGEKDTREVFVRLGDAKTTNRMWQSQPDQQLAYCGARVWARRHMPELMLGVYTPEEFPEASGPKDQGGTQYTPPTSSLSVPSAGFGLEAAVPSMVLAEEFAGQHVDTDDDELMADDSDSMEEVVIFEKKNKEWVECGLAEKRTKKQNAELHALRRDLSNKFTDTSFRAKLMATFGKNTTAELSKVEAQELIEKLREYRDKQRATFERRFPRDGSVGAPE